MGQLGEVPPARKVVLIDDDEIVLELQAGLLSEMNVQTESFDDPVPALERIRLGGVQLVITDLEMPHLDGLELLYRLKNLPHPPRVILLTAHDKPVRSLRKAPGGREAQVLRDVTDGVFAILGKPFHVDEYQRVVRAALE